MRKIIALIVSLFLIFAVAGCTEDAEYQKRQQQNQEAQNKNTLEKQNLAKKLKLEEDPERIGYIVLMVGVSDKPFGYYVVKGKVSSSGSQLDPEDLVNCGRGKNAPNSYSDYCEVIDGPQDDGTFGNGDPGIFFFTADGTYVEHNGYYTYSSQPLPSALKIPKLG